MEIYQSKGDNWYQRDIPYEKSLVLNYEIWPSQVIIGVKVRNTWITLFRDKWNNKIKFLFT